MAKQIITGLGIALAIILSLLSLGRGSNQAPTPTPTTQQPLAGQYENKTQEFGAGLYISGGSLNNRGSEVRVVPFECNTGTTTLASVTNPFDQQASVFDFVIEVTRPNADLLGIYSATTSGAQRYSTSSILTSPTVENNNKLSLISGAFLPSISTTTVRAHASTTVDVVRGAWNASSSDLIKKSSTTPDGYSHTIEDNHYFNIVAIPRYGDYTKITNGQLQCNGKVFFSAE